MTGHININVLLLSADKDNSLQVRKALAQLGISSITHADSGIDAIHLLSKSTPDLLITDMKMQFISGWLFIREMKSAGQMPSLPIILIGKTAVPVDENSLKASGVVEYLKLPDQENELKRAIRAALTLINVQGPLATKSSLAQGSTAEKNLYGSNGPKGSVNQTVKAAKVRVLCEDAGPWSEGSVECTLAHIKMLLKDHRYDEATASAQKSLTEDPRKSTYKAVVSLFFDHNQCGLAEAFCRVAINEMQYELPLFYLCQAKYQCQQKQTSACLDLLAKAEDLGGITAETSILRGACLRQIFDFEGALFSYEEALEYAPDDYRAYFNLAICSLAMQHVSEAARYLEYSLALHPQLEGAQALLAEIKAHQKPPGDGHQLQRTP